LVDGDLRNGDDDGIVVDDMSTRAGASDPMQKSFVGLMLGYASTTAIDMTATLKTFPLKLRTVEMYARSVMA
jgi:hypothetical protein